MTKLIALTDIESLRASGLPFPSEASVRWCHRHADSRGLAEAFVRIGRRVYIDPQRFHELVRSRVA